MRASPAGVSPSVPGTTTIAGTSDPTLYRAQRAGASFGYALPVPNGSYTLSLLFAEIGSDTGTNSFGATANGSSLFTGFNVYTAAGGADKALIRQFPVTVTNGQLSLNFAATTGTASLSALQLLPTSFNGLPDVPPPGYAMDAVPTDDGSGSDGAGPGSSFGVSLPSGVIENSPGADIAAYNPLGPSISYERAYRSNLVGSAAHSSAPGLTAGWSDNYDLALTSTSATSWVPLTLRYWDNAAETLTPALSGGVPTGAFAQPAGTPYYVSGTPSGTTGLWTKITLTFKDRSVYTLTPSSATSYVLTKITNVAGHSVTINRDAANGYRIISIVNDAATPATLLQFSYTGANLSSVQDLSSPMPAEQRQVFYGFGTSGGATGLLQVSQIVSLSTSSASALATPNLRWQYAYTPNGSGVYLNSVQAPDPAVGPGTLAQAVAGLDGNGHVSQFQDANGSKRQYGYSGGSVTLQVFKSGATLPDLKWFQNIVNGQHVDGGYTDNRGKTESLAYGNASNPYLPTLMTNRDNRQMQVAYRDAFGNVDHTLDPRGTQTTFGYEFPADSPAFALLGQVNSVQVTNGASQLQATTTTYFHAADVGTVAGAVNGMVRSVTTPRPGTTFGAPATVTTTYQYTALGDVQQMIAPGPNSTLGTPSTYTTVTYGYGANEAVGEPLTVTVSGLGWDAATGNVHTQTITVATYT